jgi:hypothetical protein
MGRTSWANGEILLASSAERIRDYLIEGANGQGNASYVSEEVEAELLARHDRLLDLTLAEFCQHAETARALFFRAPADETLRALILSNTRLAESEYMWGFPNRLFASEEATFAYFGQIAPNERAALFSNPSLGEEFLEAFLSLGPPWQAMEPQQRLLALRNLAGNEKLKQSPDTQDFDDGWGYYMAGKPFEAAWRLIQRLEPSADTARHLSVFLRNLPANCSDTAQIGEALGRWQTPADESDKEAQENSKGRLSACQMVRQAGARLLASHYKADTQTLFDSDDVAIRCGAYEGARKLSEKAIEAAVERDGDLARVHLISNENLWRTQALRDILIDDVRRGSDTEEPRWEYADRERQYRKKHPAWFADDRYFEPDERPISEFSISGVVTSIANEPAVRELKERIVRLEKTQQITLWLAGITLVALLSHAWK